MIIISQYLYFSIFDKSGSTTVELNDNQKLDIFDYNILVGNFGLPA